VNSVLVPFAMYGGLVNQLSFSVAHFPSALNRDGGFGLEVKLNLVLANCNLNARAALEVRKIEISRYAIHV